MTRNYKFFIRSPILPRRGFAHDDGRDGEDAVLDAGGDVSPAASDFREFRGVMLRSSGIRDTKAGANL